MESSIATLDRVGRNLEARHFCDPVKEIVIAYMKFQMKATQFVCKMTLQNCELIEQTEELEEEVEKLNNQVLEQEAENRRKDDQLEALWDVINSHGMIAG
jgi:hypothetical protein